MNQAGCHDLPGIGITVDDGGVGRLGVVVVNGARMRDLRRLKQACVRAASSNGWAEPLLLPTSARDPGAAPAVRALGLGAAMVVGVGGDGTVRACAHVLAGTGVAPAGLAPGGAPPAGPPPGAPRPPRGAGAPAVRPPGPPPPPLPPPPPH